ncbi:MAG: aminotransferase class I/II-fold pyridoxal phosphate-dependent enzyme, partial [Candidatus Eremiobacteraeota bacterium]|nr:aminotransferase class I/II-fold pyridoxal phosphate-dependent enzyme [Candidatus Eremiobacteraeota bacterium]
MKPRDFALERFFAQYEFTTKYLLCSSDPQALSIRELCAPEHGSDEGLLDVWLGYTESRGNPELRRLIAQGYDRTPEACVLVHTGSNEPIFTFMNAVLEPGDRILAQFPAYQSHYSVAEAIGAEFVPWPCDLNGEGAPDPEWLVRSIDSRTRAIVFTSPNNPTGYVFDRARLDATVEIARKHGLWLFGDEVYRGTERDAADRVPAVCDLYERGVSLGGTAKAYGLAGLRIGWIATHDRALYDRMAAFKDYLTICNPAPSEFLTAVMLRQAETLLERVREICRRNLDLLDGFFARHADRWQWHRPRAGTTAFPRYLGGSTQALCDDVVKNAGVLLLPSAAFDCGDD